MIQEALYSRILMLARSEATRKIDFKVDGIHFQGSQLATYLSIARVNKGYAIGVRVGGVPANAGAAYDQSTNNFHFPDVNFGVNEFGRQALIHESIHAWLDARVPKDRSIGGVPLRFFLDTTSLTSESLAYIGGLLFHLYDTTPAGRRPAASPPGWAGSPVFTEAYRIAVSIMQRPGVIVPATDVHALKQKIKASPTYPELAANPNLMSGFDGV